MNTSGTAYQCSDCGKIMAQDMSHRCVSTAGERLAEMAAGTGFIDGIGTVRACLDCGVLVAGGVTRCMACAQKVGPKFTVEYGQVIDETERLRAALKRLIDESERVAWQGANDEPPTYPHLVAIIEVAKEALRT